MKYPVVDGGRYFVVDGRKWRCTDPSLPEDLRQVLVNELSFARRAIKAAKRSGDAIAERAARDRVQDAKVALGERGPKWWEPMTDEQDQMRRRATLRALQSYTDVE